MLLLLIASLTATRGIAADAPPARTAPPPLEAYGQLPTIEQAEISPDGQLVALILTDGEHRKVAIEQIVDGTVIGVLAAGDQKVRGVQWAGSEHLLVETSAATFAAGVIGPFGEYLTAVDYNVRTRAQQRLLSHLDSETKVFATMNVLAGPPQIRIVSGKPFAFVPSYEFADMGREHAHVGLFKIDLSTGRTSMLAEGFANTWEWLVDAEGMPVAETEFDDVTGHWTLKTRRNAIWTVVKSLSAKLSRPLLIGLGRDARSMLLYDGDEAAPGLREFALDAQDWDAPLAVGDDFSPLVDPATHALIGVHRLIGDDNTYTFYSPADQAIWQAVVNAYPGETASLASWSDDHRHLMVHVDSPTEGPAYAYIDVDARKATWFGQTQSAASAYISPVAPIAFGAADGMSLTGYLTLPRGKAPTQLPLVVLPHGGPAARDTLGFDWWAQAIASRGYAVLQVNYRGSDGFGWDLKSAGFGQWGRKMQTDLSDGVRYLAQEGRIDPKRVCIVGASYGGYAALAGAALERDVYRCAAAVAGPADLRRFVNWARTDRSVSAQRYWLRFMGADGTRDAALEQISPAAHADNVVAPILLVHGRDDTVVPFEQTQLMADALKHAGKPYELVVLEHEDHWLSRGDTRLQMLRAVMDFLARNNPPD